MILTCPSCETQFRVAANAIPEGGRMVRCASCKHQWHAYPESEAAELSPLRAQSAADAPFISSELRAGREPDLVAFQEYQQRDAMSEEEDRALHAKADAIEDYVAHHLPHDVDEEGSSFDDADMPQIHFGGAAPARRFSLRPLLYIAAALLLALLGTLAFLLMPELFGSPPSKGLVLSEVQMRERKGRDNVRFVVEGKILNTTEEARPIPKVRVSVMGNDGAPILSRDYVGAEGAMIKAGEAVPFRATDLQTTQVDKVDYLLIDLGSGAELLKRPIAWLGQDAAPESVAEIEPEAEPESEAELADPPAEEH